MSEKRIDKSSTIVGDFVVNNIKSIGTCIIFICGLYIQHQANVVKISHMEKELAQIRSQVDDQYVKLDNMKLDKAVFEATMKQFTDMSTDIREIRERLEDMMSDKHGSQSGSKR